MTQKYGPKQAVEAIRVNGNSPDDLYSVLIFCQECGISAALVADDGELELKVRERAGGWQTMRVGLYVAFTNHLYIWDEKAFRDAFQPCVREGE